MHSSSLHNPCLSKIEKGFMSPTIISATHWFSERALWWLGVNFIFPAVSWSVNHFLADDVTANLQVFLPLLLCRRNHKYSFCHGNAVRCRGLCDAGDSIQASLFLPAQINSWVWKVRHKLPHSVFLANGEWRLLPGLDLGYCEDLFSVGSMTVSWTVKKCVCVAFHLWNRSWIIHCEALLQIRDLSLLFKKKKFLLLSRRFCTYKFWTVVLANCSWLLVLDALLGRYLWLCLLSLASPASQ